MATRNHLEMCIIFLVRVNLQRIGVGEGASELPHRICGATGSLKYFKKIPLCHSVASGLKSKKVVKDKKYITQSNLLVICVTQ